jgi:hypothetical protein
MSLRGEENSVPPHGALNDMHRGFDMMQLDVGDELGRGGVGMGWAEVVLWVRGVDTARFLFFKTLFPWLWIWTHGTREVYNTNVDNNGVSKP